MSRVRRSIYLVLSLAITLFAGETLANDSDPWEGINRKVFAFNETMDDYILRPVAKGYQAVTPQFADDGVTHFLDNLGELKTIFNDLLQGKVKQAGHDSARFLINTTVGMFGFFDVASQLGLERHIEDYGQTFAVWGLDSGPYLMLPFLGPSTIRDGTGMVPAWYFSASNLWLNDPQTNNSLLVTDIIDKRADLIKAEAFVFGDKYILIRDAYLQRREFLINDGVVQDDFGEEDFEAFEDDDFFREE